jgi:hypothetical protein
MLSGDQNRAGLSMDLHMGLRHLSLLSSDGLVA